MRAPANTISDVLTTWTFGLTWVLLVLMCLLGVLAAAVVFGGWLRDLPGMRQHNRDLAEKRRARDITRERNHP